VTATFDVDIDRPRRIDSPEVSELAAQITDRLRDEVRRHAQR
jgi:NitT/TauT family transport system ATP-binding protein